MAALTKKPYYTSNSPAADFEAVTPHDSTGFRATSRGIYVGVTGNVVAVNVEGDAVTFTAVPAGSVLPIQCIRVNSTNTTASSMVVLY